ncbi:uncharacterized protein AC631_04592 [Debaryomyces fabryi]|uniref:C2H2-type domain-containing protein n=1 Tax=Debaryomyces fabryi TaxID=58627 RepID=A0A0V1PTS1_9ASCO|nr:uncharacterized protein AC631_04592 [Debaryomyces fabryi]KRZ99651.1 hypothetical protein AC631_04592 [Debaryomyces fabryi]
MHSQVQQNNATLSMEFSNKIDKLEGDSGAEGTGNGGGQAGANKKQKSIPLELTAYGTTPSGKPRLFVCQICTRAFARLEHLRRHERSHTKEKPFSCGVCQRKFSRRDLLLRHAQKLHAGCADAITRLRRKSIKRSGSVGDDMDDDMVSGTPGPVKDAGSPGSTNPSSGHPSQSPLAHQPSGSHGDFDLVLFNLNLFNHKGSLMSKSASNSGAKDGTTSSLQKQIFDRRKIDKHRGASFSAQSGGNYAMGLAELNDLYPGTDHVEFSTPQLYPTGAPDEHAWLNNLSTIPGMNDNNNNSNSTNGTHANGTPNGVHNGANLNGPKGTSRLPRQSSISSISLDHNEAPASVSHQGSFSGHLPTLRSDSLASTSSYNTYDSLNGLQYMMPSATVSNNEITPFNSANTNNHMNNQHNEEYGYSFYDIPESMMANSGNHFKLSNHLTPIKQEDDEMTMTSMNHENNTNHTNTNGFKRNPSLSEDNVNNNNNNNNNNNINENNNNHQGGSQNFDLNFLNDIGELTNEFDVNAKFMPNGYSFYGDNNSVSSSGMETNSPQMISPSVSQSQYQSETSLPQPQPHLIHQQPISDHNYLNQSHLMNFDHTKKRRNSFKAGNYSKNKLFTNNIRYMINKSLSKYPINGIMTPTIPSNEKLEFYTNNFVNIFLSHFPFIHISKLNEYEIMSMTSNEDLSNESARVCLPLLTATIGALLANNKNDSEHLYEASRRTIHIYLESRKNSVNEATSNSGLSSTPQSTNPLWLIQSLTLSVIYGLFSDNENNVYIVIRQLNALNSLVKTSIKSNRTVLFSINGEDEDIYNKMNEIKSNDFLQNDSLFSTTSFNINDEIKFKNIINIQSQTRIVFMIYRLTNFLLMMYNVPLTLSINDLGLLEAPTRKDEFLWSFKNYQSFQEYNQNNHTNKTLNDYLNPNGNKMVFREILYQITKADVHNGLDDVLSEKLNNLSQFGFVSIVNGIYESKQYPDLQNMDVFAVLDNLTSYIGSPNFTFPIANENINGNQSISESFHSKSTADFEKQKLDFALLVNFVKVTSLIDFKYVKEQSWLRNFDELTSNFNSFLSTIHEISDYDYLRIVDCCIIIVKLVLFKTESNNSNSSAFDTHMDLKFMHDPTSNRSLINEYESTSTVFEKLIDIKVYDGEFDISKNSIHLQMLFHVFSILSVFSIHLIRKNNDNEINSTLKSELNQRFNTVLMILGKIENFLKNKYQNLKLENQFTNLYLYSNGNNNGEFGPLHGNNLSNEYNYSLEKTLYILKIGELLLGFIYDTNIKVCIFKKLSGSLSQIRKFLIDNESKVLS